MVMNKKEQNPTGIYFEDLKKIQDAIPGIEFLYNKCVLITGSTGLIGSAVVDFLCVLNDTKAANITILAASRRLGHLENRFGSMLNRRDLYPVEYNPLIHLCPPQKPDFIIHTAAPANPRWYSEKPVETIQSIYCGLFNVLEYARTYRIHRVLFISSSEIYGRKESHLPYTDKEYGFIDILNARACYPSAKRLGETMCAAYYQEYGVDSVIARPGHIYGPFFTKEDSRASSEFLSLASSGKDIIMKSPGQQLRSYCYICDCVSALLTVLINGQTVEAYNISNPDSICTIRDIAECIAQDGGVRIIFKVPSESERRGFNMMDNSSLDSSRLEALGWNGLFDLKTGVEHTIRIIREKQSEDTMS